MTPTSTSGAPRSGPRAGGLRPAGARLPDGPGGRRRRRPRGAARRARPRDRRSPRRARGTGRRMPAASGPPRPAASPTPSPPRAPRHRTTGQVTTRPLDPVRQPTGTRPRLPDARCRCVAATSSPPRPTSSSRCGCCRASSPAPFTGHLSQGVQDQQAFEWYFGATAHNLATLSNPLFSDLQNFPDGVNLMANAAVLGLGVPLAPLTLLAGPQVTFILVELLGLTLTASAWFWLFRRRLAVHPLAAALGAGFAGFAPGLVSHANGHPNFVAQFARAARRRPGAAARRGRPPGAGTVSCWGCSSRGRSSSARRCCCSPRSAWPSGRRCCSRTAGSTCAGCCPGLGARPPAVCLVVVAVPLWWQFAGPAELRLDLPPTRRQRPRPAVGQGHPQHRRRPVGVGRAVDEPHRGELVLRHPAAPRGRSPSSSCSGAACSCAPSPRSSSSRCWLSLGEEVDAQRRSPPASPARGRCSRACPSSRTCCPPASPSSRSRRSVRSSPSARGGPRRVGRYAGHAGAGLAVARHGRRRSSCCRCCPHRSSSTRAPRCRVLQRRHVARPRRRGRLGARRPRTVGRRHPRPGVAGPGPGGASPSSPATSSARTSRRSAVGQYGATPTALTQWMAAIAESGVARRSRPGRARAVPRRPARRPGRRRRAARGPARGAGAARLPDGGVR